MNTSDKIYVVGHRGALGNRPRRAVLNVRAIRGALRARWWCGGFLRVDLFVVSFSEHRKGIRRVAAIGGVTLGPFTALYFPFPQMDKGLLIICGMAGPFAYVLLVKSCREMLPCSRMNSCSGNA